MNKKVIKPLFLLSFAFCLAFLPPLATFAVETDDYSPIDDWSESKLRRYAEDNILYYDDTYQQITRGIDCSLTVENPSPDPGETPSVPIGERFGLSEVQYNFVVANHDAAVQHSINYGIPWETVIAQGILESKSGTSRLAKLKNNFFGLGAKDSCPFECALTFSSPSEGWKGYYDFIARNPRYRKNGVFSGEAVTNPYAYLRAIKAAGYATDPDYISKISKLISFIEALSKSKSWDSSAELAAKHPEWHENAAKNGAGGNAYNPSGEAGTGLSENTGTSVYCLTPGQDGPTTTPELKAGGFTVEEARNFMSAYIAEASKKLTGSYEFNGGYIVDAGCKHGTLNNCSAFSEWFASKYLGVNTKSRPHHGCYFQGSQLVSTLTNCYGLNYNGKTPVVYSVFSHGPYSGSADGWANHTGVVLGIDVERDLIITGEASCSNGYINGVWPGVKTYSLSKWTNNPSKYGPTYAYKEGFSI